MPGPFEIGPVSADEPPAGPPPAARYLNPGTGDYERQADGEYRGMPVVRQRVVLALRTLKGSRWPDPDFGNDALSIRRIDQRFEANARSKIRSALRQLIDVEKVVALQNVSFRRINTGHIETTIQYTDLTNGQPDSVTV